MQKSFVGIVISIAVGAAAVLIPSSPLRAQQTDPVIRQGAPTGGAVPANRPVLAPPNTDDTAATTDANAVAAAAAEAQTRKIIADKQAYRAAYDKTIADNDAKMEAYRQQVRENEARNAEIRRRNEATAALYKACVAGDKAACQRYNAGP